VSTDQSKASDSAIELFGVYDADATLVGEASYWIGARLGIRHCSLCDITHSLFREKSQWRECVDRLKKDHNVTFHAFHRNDQPDNVRQVINGAYPAVVAQHSNGSLTLFLNSDQISECGIDPEAFYRKIVETL
jgi:hypothetical protein